MEGNNLPNIRPSAEIRNNYPELSKLCKETGQPVYITVNGKGDVALIDIGVLDELYARLALYEQLSVGLRDIDEGRVKTHEEIFAQFRK